MLVLATNYISVVNVNFVLRIASIIISFSIYESTEEEAIPTDFPRSIMDVGAVDGVSMFAASPVTWLGTRQKITCRAHADKVSHLTIEPLCKLKGCQYSENNDIVFVAYPTPIQERVSEVSFRADSLWNNTAVYCRAYKQGATMRQYAVPILVRALPKLIISPSPAEVHRNSTLVIRCRSESELLSPKSLQWRVVAPCQSNNYYLCNKSMNATITGSESIVTLRPHEINLGISIIRCSARLGAEPPFLLRQSSTRLVSQGLPTLSFSPTFLDVYEGQRYTVSCLAIFPGTTKPPSSRQIASNDQSLTIPWFVQMSVQETEDEPEKLKFDVSSVNTLEASLTFQASWVWNQRSITCEMSTGDESDAIETRRTIKVNIYSPPNVTIVPAFPLVESGVHVALTCIAEGIVSGGLQMIVQCDDCYYQIEPSTIGTTHNAKRSLYFIATSRWDGVTVVCSVLGTNGWPSAMTTVEVIGVAAMRTVQWTVLGLGSAGAVAVMIFVALKMHMRYITRQKQLEATSTAQQDVTFTTDSDPSGTVRSKLQSQAGHEAAKSVNTFSKPATTEQHDQSSAAADELSCRKRLPQYSKAATSTVPTLTTLRESNHTASKALRTTRQAPAVRSQPRTVTRSLAATTATQLD